MSSARLFAIRAPLAVVMVGIGVLHFVADDLFMQIVPPLFPRPYLLVWISGVIEIVLGIALLVPRTRRAAGFGLVALPPNPSHPSPRARGEHAGWMGLRA